jgi:redox-sensing transcriptional repressor
MKGGVSDQGGDIRCAALRGLRRYADRQQQHEKSAATCHPPPFSPVQHLLSPARKENARAFVTIEFLVKTSNKAAFRTTSPKQSPEQVSELTTNRLSVYLRCLNALDDAGVRTISSQALAEQFHLNAAQIRKDLAYFGEFGVRGVGYYVRDLKRHLRQILGLDRKLRVAIMGAGNLGLALADYPGFRQEGFEISALFDTLSSKVGQRSRGGVPIHDIHDLKRIVRRDGISIAVIAVPAPSAQHVVNLVVSAGIKAVLNFSPGTLQAPPDVKLKSVDLTVSLESLSFFLAQGEGNGA